jgi:RND family efflux transporter MFP subunit
VGWVKEAAPVRVFVEGRTGPVAGTVHWAGLEADPQTGKFAIEIQVDNPDLELRPGVLGRAQVETRKHEGVLAVPRDAIVQKLEGPFVFVADGDRARRRPVVLGPDQDLMVVVDRGLAAGDRLIVRGQRELVDGARIQVREEATTPEGSIDGEELPAPVAGGDPR